MKENQTIRLTLLLSFLVVVTKGKGVSYTKRGQVNKTIQTKEGDVYDCIDVNAQPSLNHPLLKDHEIQMQPSSFPTGLDIKPLFPHSESEVQPSMIDCPVGTVPILRNNRNGTIAAHNINVKSSIGLQREAAGIQYHGDIYGVSATINIWEPKVNKDSKDLSATWVHINNGGGDHVDSIGVGLEVNPSFSGDTFVRFHIGWAEGVYKTKCIDHSCPGFVLVNNNIGLGSRMPHVSVFNGTQWILPVRIFKDTKTNNWFVTIGEKNRPVGYWPNAMFHFVDLKGNFAFWGGFVQGPTASSNAPQMGSGRFASEGFRKAAYVREIQVLNENNNFFTPEYDFKVDHGTTNATLYTDGRFHVETSGLSIYYGGPGLVV